MLDVYSEIANIEYGGPETRDFTSAIGHAVSEIEKLQYAGGSALIVVKTGTYESLSRNFFENSEFQNYDFRMLN